VRLAGRVPCVRQGRRNSIVEPTLLLSYYCSYFPAY
jgi:hypothetical protein